MAEVKATKWQPWTPSFIRALRAIQPTRDKAPNRQVRSYRALNRWVKTETFGYCNKEAELTGKLALLELWARLLDLIDWRQSGNGMNHLAYDYIATLMTRQEFDLIHILTPSHMIGPSTNNTHSNGNSNSNGNGSSPKEVSSSSTPMLSSAPILSPSASSASLLNIERPPPSHLNQFEHIRVFQHYRAVLGRTLLAVMELLQQCDTELHHGTAHIRKMRVKMATNPDSVIPPLRSHTNNTKIAATNVTTPSPSPSSTSTSKHDDGKDGDHITNAVPPVDGGQLDAPIIDGQTSSSSSTTTATATDTSNAAANDATATATATATAATHNGNGKALHVIKEKDKPASDADRTVFDQQLHMSQCMEPQLQTFVTKILAVCFFRMPILSGPLLDAICTPPIPIIPDDDDDDDDEEDDHDDSGHQPLSPSQTPVTSSPLAMIPEVVLSSPISSTPSTISSLSSAIAAANMSLTSNPASSIIIATNVSSSSLSSSSTSTISDSSSASSVTSTSVSTSSTPTPPPSSSAPSTSSSSVSSSSSSSNATITAPISMDIDEMSLILDALAASRRRSTAVTIAPPLPSSTIVTPMTTATTASPSVSPTLVAASSLLPNGFTPMSLPPSSSSSSSSMTSSTTPSSSSSSPPITPSSSSSSPSQSPTNTNTITSDGTVGNGAAGSSTSPTAPLPTIHPRQLRPSRATLAGVVTPTDDASSSLVPSTPSLSADVPVTAPLPNNNHFLPFRVSAVAASIAATTNTGHVHGGNGNSNGNGADDDTSVNGSPLVSSLSTGDLSRRRKTGRSTSAPLRTRHNRHRRQIAAAGGAGGGVGGSGDRLPSPVSSADQSSDSWWLPALYPWQRTLMNEIDNWVNVINTAHNSRARMRVLARGGDRGRDRDVLLGVDATTGMKFPAPSPAVISKNGHTTLQVVTCDFVVDEVRSRSHTIESNVDSQHALFLANNPSLFEWTNGDLTEQSNRLPKAMVAKREQLLTLIDTAARSELNAAGVDLVTDAHMGKSYPLPSLDESKLVIAACSGVLRHTMADTALFFLFIRAWLSHVLDSSRGAVVWSSVPAYLPVVQAFLRRMVRDPRCFTLPGNVVQMCQRELLRHSEHTEYLSFAVTTMLRTTRLTVHSEVNNAFDMLDDWFKARPNAGPDLAAPLPITFCLDLVIQAIALCIASDHFQSIIKALTFLYMNIGRVYGHRRTRLLDTLILSREAWTRLFFHWSPQVRRIYYHILLYRLTRSANINYSWLEPSNVPPQAPSVVLPVVPPLHLIGVQPAPPSPAVTSAALVDANGAVFSASSASSTDTSSSVTSETSASASAPVTEIMNDSDPELDAFLSLDFDASSLRTPTRVSSAAMPPPPVTRTSVGLPPPQRSSQSSSSSGALSSSSSSSSTTVIGTAGPAKPTVVMVSSSAKKKDTMNGSGSGASDGKEVKRPSLFQRLSRKFKAKISTSHTTSSNGTTNGSDPVDATDDDDDIMNDDHSGSGVARAARAIGGTVSIDSQLLLPGDPTPDTCRLVVTPFSADELMIDAASMSKLSALLADVRDQHSDASLSYYPRHIMVYATAALTEFTACGQSYRRLQLAAGLAKVDTAAKSSGRQAVTAPPIQPAYMRVLIPFLSFDIGGDDKNSSNG